MTPWTTHVAIHAAGLTLAALVLAILTVLARRSASVCHRMLVAALLAAFVLPVTQIAVEGRAAWLAPEAVRALWTDPAPRPGTEPALAEAPDPAIVSEPGPEAEASDAAVAAADPAPDRFDGLAGAAASAWPSMPALLAGLWLAGAFFFGRRLLSRVVATARTVRAAAPITDSEVLSAWGRVAGRVRVPRVRLLASPAVEVPACCGIFRRILLVPADPEVRPRGNALECALLHEGIHLERRDPLVALLQSLLTLALWWHPAAWWLARELDFWRELSCDEEVVRRTGWRRDYAGALLEHAARISGIRGGPDPCPSLIAWTRTGTQIRRRIEMLVRNRQPWKPLRRAAVVTAALIAGFGIWSGQIALAATLFPPQSAPAEGLEPVQPPAEQETTQEAEGKLGISVDEVGEALAAQIGKPAGELMLVSGVAPGSVAEKGGLQKWDVITAIDGKGPADMERLQEARKNINEGGSARITVSRQGRQRVLTLGAAASRRAAPRAATSRPRPEPVPQPAPHPTPHPDPRPSPRSAPSPSGRPGQHGHPPAGEHDPDHAERDHVRHEHLEAVHEALKKLGGGEAREALQELHRALEHAAPHVRHGVEEAHRAAEEAFQEARRAMEKAAPYAREGAEEARRAVQEAMKHAERAMAEGKNAWKKSMEDAHREIERATAGKRSEVERAVQDAQREVERATAERHAEVQRAVREAQQEVERVTRETRAEVERTVKEAQREVERATKEKRAEVERAVQEARRNDEERAREAERKHAGEARRMHDEAAERERRTRQAVEDRDRAADREARSRRPSPGKGDPRPAQEAEEEDRLRAELDATRKALEDARRRLEELRKKERDARPKRERDEDDEDRDEARASRAAPGAATRPPSGDAPAAGAPDAPGGWHVLPGRPAGPGAGAGRVPAPPGLPPMGPGAGAPPADGAWALSPGATPFPPSAPPAECAPDAPAPYPGSGGGLPGSGMAPPADAPAGGVWSPAPSRARAPGHSRTAPPADGAWTPAPPEPAPCPEPVPAPTRVPAPAPCQPPAHPPGADSGSVPGLPPPAPAPARPAASPSATTSVTPAPPAPPRSPEPGSAPQEK